MKVLRLFISEPSGTCESVHYRLPIRIGGDGGSDCVSRKMAASRFLLELDWDRGRLVLRDLGTRDCVRVRVADEMRELRGRELTTGSRELEFAMAGIWIRAVLEERTVDEFVEAAQRSIDQLIEACAQASERDAGAALLVLGALGHGARTLRASLQAGRDVRRGERGEQQDEVVSVLARWAQALLAAVSLVEGVLVDDARLSPR